MWDGWSPAVVTTPAVFTTTSITANYTPVSEAEDILADCTAGNITITMPLSTTNGAIQYRIVKTDSSPNSVILQCQGSDTINGVAAFYLSDQWQAVSLVCYAGGYVNMGGI